MQRLKERQAEYAAEMDMQRFGDTAEKLNEELASKPLILPINTKKRPREKRILEIHEHFKTQCLFGLEFDLSHLLVGDEADKAGI